jgi:2-oxo-3-hexenedioate decarboxylase
MLDEAKLLEMARYLDDALTSAREVKRLTETEPKLTLEEAYRIQDLGIELRRERGQVPRGLKMGLTSRAKREQMGLHSPIYGVLTREMELADGATFSLKGSIHPKIEPEIAFITGPEVRGRIGLEQAEKVCIGACAAMEILDSRFLNFKYFSLEDVVADNCSSAWFVLSPTVRSLRGLDLANLRMTMEVDGAEAQTALSSEISGHPLQSVVQLCEILDSRGLALPAGSVVLAGAATVAVQLKPGARARLTVEGLGSVSLNVAG